MESQPASNIESIKRQTVMVPSVVAIIAAILLCASYFLPFTMAKEDSIVTSQFAQSFEIYEGSGVTASDLANPSIITWARFYKAYCDRLEKSVTSDLNDYSFVFWLIVVSGALAVLALLFALLRKATPTALFALANLGLMMLISQYFEDYGPVSSGAASNWAFGRMALLGFAAVLVAAGIWLFIAKWRQKHLVSGQQQ